MPRPKKNKQPVDIAQQEQLMPEVKEQQEQQEQQEHKTAITNLLMAERYEYFDERFYKFKIPKDYDLENTSLPDAFIEETEDSKYIYVYSVTTKLGIIIDPFLLNWYGSVGYERAIYTSWKAKELGSIIHDVIDKRLNGYDVIYSPKKIDVFTEEMKEQYKKEVNDKLLVIDNEEVAVQLARYEQAISSIRNSVDLNIVMTESSVYNIKEAYAGTLDQVWFLKPKEGKVNKTVYPEGYIMVDIKTGKNIYDTPYYAQLSAYANADNIVPYNVKGAIILHLNANRNKGIDGYKIHYISREELDDYYEYFLSVSKAFMFQKKKIVPIKFNIPKLFNSKLINNDK